MTNPPIARGLQHAVLEVRDMDKSIAFYREVFGLKLTERHAAGEVEVIQVELAFLRLGENHHDLVLAHNPNKTYRDREPEDDVVGLPGLHHIAMQYADRAAWKVQLERAREMNLNIVRGPIVHSAHHPRGEGTWGENESFYVLDPDGYRVELFCDMGTINAEGAFIDAYGKTLDGLIADEI